MFCEGGTVPNLGWPTVNLPRNSDNFFLDFFEGGNFFRQKKKWATSSDFFVLWSNFYVGSFTFYISRCLKKDLINSGQAHPYSPEIYGGRLLAFVDSFLPTSLTFYLTNFIMIYLECVSFPSFSLYS